MKKTGHIFLFSRINPELSFPSISMPTFPYIKGTVARDFLKLFLFGQITLLYSVHCTWAPYEEAKTYFAKFFWFCKDICVSVVIDYMQTRCWPLVVDYTLTTMTKDTPIEHFEDFSLTLKEKSGQQILGL